MAISVVRTATASGGAGTPVTVTITTPTSGNLLVAVGGVVTNTNQTFTTPSGWTVARVGSRIASYWKVSDGSETSVQFAGIEATSVSKGWYWELAGADTTTPIDTTGYTTHTNAATASPVTDANMAQNDDWAAAVELMQGANGGSEAATNSYSLTTDIDDREIGATRIYSATGSGTTATTTMTWTTGRAGQWLIVTVKPAATGNATVTPGTVVATASVGVPSSGPEAAPTPIQRVGPDRRAGN